MQKQSMTQYYTDYINTGKNIYIKLQNILDTVQFYSAFKVIKVQHSNTHV